MTKFLSKFENNTDRIWSNEKFICNFTPKYKTYYLACGGCTTKVEPPAPFFWAYWLYKDKLLTITTDNGSEFAEHQWISRQLGGVPVYFTDSYSSWQKGAVENTNKLIRQYIPKVTDISMITDNYITKVQKKINRRPREKLNFSTPIKEFYKHYS